MIGHEPLKKYFAEAILHGTLAHAYCLVGPEGVGKRAVATWVAAQLLQTPEEKVKQHPNYIYVARREDEKTGKLKKEITVAQARELKAALTAGVWGSGYRVVIIDDAELLNAEAGNALLKLLEEAPTQTVFFLLTTNDFVLLPTIRSRVQLMHCLPVADDAIQRAAQDNGATPEVAQEIARFALGRPGPALEMARNAQTLAWYRQELARWKSLAGNSLHKKISLVEDLFGDKDDGVRGRAHLSSVLELWMAFARTSLLTGSSEAAQIIDRIAQGRAELDKNVHPRLIVENILLHI